ncbi:MAG: Spx/MgsR family RNA polymerase-binding regulatory protein, partial [Polyangiales bacterium]
SALKNEEQGAIVTSSTWTLWHYPKCSSCRKARQWLEAHAIPFALCDLTVETPNVAVLRDLWQRSGLVIGKLFNTSGRVYRTGGFSARLKTMTDEEALAALAADGMLIKRPVLDTGMQVVVGFAAARYEACARAHGL